VRSFPNAAVIVVRTGRRIKPLGLFVGITCDFGRVPESPSSLPLNLAEEGLREGCMSAVRVSRSAWRGTSASLGRRGRVPRTPEAKRQGRVVRGWGHWPKGRRRA